MLLALSWDFFQYKVTRARQTDEGVVVTITDRKNSSLEVPMVLVDSAWVVADCAKEWKEGIVSAKKEIADWNISPVIYRKIMTSAPALQFGISQMRSAKSRGQLEMAQIGFAAQVCLLFVNCQTKGE